MQQVSAIINSDLQTMWDRVFNSDNPPEVDSFLGDYIASRFSLPRGVPCVEALSKAVSATKRYQTLWNVHVRLAVVWRAAVH